MPEDLPPDPVIVIEGPLESAKPMCEGCALYPDQNDEKRIGFFEVKRRDEELLRKYKILTKAI